LRKNICPVCRAELPLEGAGPHCLEQDDGEDLEDLPEMVRQNGISIRESRRDETGFRSRLQAVIEQERSCADRQPTNQTRRSVTLQGLGNAMQRGLRRLSI
jgi:hypothetical protein